MPVRLDHRLWFPEPSAVANPDGLVAVGGDLSPSRLILAYRSGIFPWSVHPVTWWSPDPRAIFELERFHVSKSLAKIMRRGIFRATVNRAFRPVIEACSAPGPGRHGTWITPEFIDAYCLLHKSGYAHSLECWQNGILAGGVYGVAIGGLFAAESMFHRADNASKVALAHLIELLRSRGYMLLDIQMLTRHTASLGAIEISRDNYLGRLKEALSRTCSLEPAVIAAGHY